MLRTIIAFVIFTGTINAEPIPKKSEDQMAKLFGKPLLESDECKVSLTRKNALLVEQTSKHKLFNFGVNRNEQPLPYVAKEVEIEGDFVVTIRCQLTLPKEAKPVLRNEIRLREELAFAAAGIAINSEGLKVQHVTSLHNGKKAQNTGFSYTTNQSATTTYDSGELETKPMYLRVSRIGDVLKFSRSTDPAKYDIENEIKIRRNSTKFHIGPLFYHNTDSTCSAEFDEFTIEPLEKK